MAALRFESPLVWPEWIQETPRANQRNDHGLTAQLTLTESINFLEQELQDIGASAVLYLDIEQPLIDRLRKKIGSRTGAAMQMRFKERSYVLACDKWQTVEHNVYVLHLTIRQWRNIERWGVTSLETLLQPFATDATASIITASGDNIPNWMHTLGLGPTSTLDDAIAVYHRRAKQAAHDSDTLAKLNILMEEVRAYFASRG